MNRALQWKLVAGFVLVFLAGGVTGAFVGMAQARNKFFQTPHRAFLKERMGDRLRKQLNLTPEQVQKISPIVDKASTDLETIRTETTRRVHETMAQAHRDMAVNLTDEQRTKLQEMESRHRGRRMLFHERHPPPSPEADDRQD
jgi:Spy/CpxP family protein refolding chaperone